MNIKDLQYYVSLTQLKNFSKVANNFHVSQPTISSAINRLEKEFNCCLIIRDNPHLPLKLTTSGQKLLTHGQIILDEYHLTQQEILHGEKEKLVIGMPPIIEITYLPRVASQLPSELFQQIIHVSQGSIATLNDLKNGSLDVALLGYLDELDDPSIHLINFDQQPFSVVVPKNHPLVGQNNLLFKDLHNENFITLKNSFVQKQAFRNLSKSNHLRPKVIYEASEVQSVLNMVAHNMGIALLSDSIVLNDSNLTRVALHDTNLPIFKVALAYRKTMQFSLEQKSLIASILKAFLPND